MTDRIPNIHPGEILLEEFMEPMGISQNRLARDLGVPPNRIHAIVKGKRSITADTALRLARYFGTSPEFWLGLQMEYDLEEAAQKAGNELERIVPVATDVPAEVPMDEAPAAPEA
ncbi:MAG: transcriptional regulator [Fimbriimonadales bacterium]|nr:MAG: transcriptional regulator [Fimbriimonadales bacterium]